MSSIGRLWLLLTLAGSFAISAPLPAMTAQETHFSLAVGQSVVAGQYTVYFRGLTDKRLPSYDVYVGSALVAHLPSGAPPPSYRHANVRIVTTTVAPNGGVATGTITVE
jgi:hypothetical protein